MRLSTLLAGSVLMTFGVGANANANIIVQNSNFISSPAFFNGFEAINSSPNFFIGDGIVIAAGNFYPSNTAYSEGGITIQYVGCCSSIWVDVALQGNFGWYPNGGSVGYDKITLTGGGNFQNIQFLSENGYGVNTTLAYQLLAQGLVVASGTITNAAFPAHYLGFSGGGFDEVDLQSGFFSAFDPANFEALVIDSIAANGTAANVPGPSTNVPEPSTLPLFGAALMACLLALRRRKRPIDIGVPQQGPFKPDHYRY